MGKNYTYTLDHTLGEKSHGENYTYTYTLYPMVPVEGVYGGTQGGEGEGRASSNRGTHTYSHGSDSLEELGGRVEAQDRGCKREQDSASDRFDYDIRVQGVHKFTEHLQL